MERCLLHLEREESFASAAPNLWNDLPSEISSLVSLFGFKRTLKTYLFKRALHA